MAKEYHSKYKSWIIDHFSSDPALRAGARDIYEQMRNEGLGVNLVTVYRNLDRLAVAGVLHRQKVPGEDEYSYQYRQPSLACDSHLHLYCSKCGKVIHLNCGFMQEITDHLKQDHGFQIDCRNSMIVGLCDECQKQIDSASGGNVKAERKDKGKRESC